VQPRGVLGEPATRQVAQTSGFCFTDAVFHPGMLPVTRVPDRRSAPR
jgi:hypothetical protein